MEEAGGLHFFRKRDEIRRIFFSQTPFFVRPECTGGPNTGLDFVHNQRHAMLFGDAAKLAEEFGRCVLVSTFRRYRFDDDCSDRLAVFPDVMV